MTRYTLNDGPTQVTYGFDRATGYFIDIVDVRLARPDNAPNDVAAANSATANDDTSCYLNAHTGRIGFGKRITKQGMAELWKLYGVEHKLVDRVKNGLMLDGSGPVVEAEGALRFFPASILVKGEK